MIKKKAAILQSNYIPWKGYFDMINMVDEFILYDDVQYTKNDWRNRNQIKAKNGKHWITIPVHQENLEQMIKDTSASNDIWRKKHWKTIIQNYSKAKHFNDYKELFEKLYLDSNERLLSRINHRFLIAICGILGIKTKISWSMDYRLIDGQTERLVDLCKQVCATEYLSGPAAKDYIDENLFKSEGISIQYMDYTGYPEYDQLYPPFDHAVSIIDLIFNEGPDASKYMKSFLSWGFFAGRKNGM